MVVAVDPRDRTGIGDLPAGVETAFDLDPAGDEVGRDIAEIEMTVGCKPIIRSSAEDGQRLWEAQMANNRTPMSDVLDDDTFWVGTPDLIAERMAERKALGFHTFLAEVAAPYDDETLDRWINEVVPMVDVG